MKLFRHRCRVFIPRVVLLTAIILWFAFYGANAETDRSSFSNPISQAKALTISKAVQQVPTKPSLLLAETNKSKKTERYPVRKGEAGVKNRKYQYGDVRRYGAVGDGVHDDHHALMNALNQNKTVYLQTGKTYKCNDGFYMNNGQIIRGNNATLLIDDDYAPQNDMGYKFLRSRWGKSGTTYEIYDLTITYDSDHTIQNFPGEFILFYPDGFEKVIMNKVTLQAVDGSSKVHLMYACSGKTIMEEVKLINNNTAISGGCLWLNNTTSRVASIDCKNSYFYNSSSDEALAVYGSGSAQGSFVGCTFESTNEKLRKDTLPIAIYDASMTGYSGEVKAVDIEFKQCNFIERFDPDNKYVNVCYLGVGSSNFNKFITVTLNECTMNNENPASPFGLREHYISLNGTNFISNSVINVNQSELFLNSSIAGTYSAWVKKEAVGTTLVPSIHIKDSKIECEYAVIDIPNTQNYPINASIDSCKIQIRNAISLVKAVYRVPLAISIMNNTITADQTLKKFTSVYGETHKTIPLNATEKISIKNNVLNKKKLKDLEIHRDLNQ